VRVRVRRVPIDTLGREVGEAAARWSEREQAEALKAKLPEFWLPSLMPTADAPRSLSELQVQSA
jgi:nitric oxide synthase-interacting protein